jgi:arylsulfatase A-like enzyme
VPSLIRAALVAALVVALTPLGPTQLALGTGRDGSSEPGSAGAARANSEQPNIVVLMLDDNAFLDHRIWERLPNIKALFLDQGVEALNFWGNDPLCCPGRANFLTAQVAHVSGVIKNDGRPLNPNTTIATELDALGYYTNICGKYLNGTDRIADKSPPGWDNVAIMVGSYYRYTAWVNDVVEQHGSNPADYSTDVFADHCQAFLDAAPADQPLFAFMTPFSPHKGADRAGVIHAWEPVAADRHFEDERCAGIAPWKPVNYNSASLNGKPAYVRSRPLLGGTFVDGYPMVNRCRALLSVDDWLGRVVDTLKGQGRFENTIFVFTVDNGMGYGAFRWPRKGAPHTAQLPLFISWPGVIGGPAQISDLLSNVDLAPTLCEFAGCEMGPYPNGKPANGQSFAGLIAPALSASVPQRSAIVLENAGAGEGPPWRGIMTNPAQHRTGQQWYFIKYSTGERELYDLSGGVCYAWQAGMPGDPCMLTNLSPSRPGVRRALNAELTALW